MRYASGVGGAVQGRGGWNVHLDALRQRADGRDIIVLTVGDPDQAPPQRVISATIEALRSRRTGYSPILGVSEVRAAIAARVARRTAAPCAAENVAVVPGAQAGLFCTLRCLAGQGDEVIVPEPMYATYQAVVRGCGAQLVNVPLAPETGFHPDLGSLRDAVTRQTRAIWINSPHNPTGAVLMRSEIAGIAEICQQNDLWLVSDEVYEDLAYARDHVGPWSLPGLCERTVVISSLSKSYAIPGFRFGWIVGPAQFIANLFPLIVSMFYGAPPFIQAGVLPALTEELPEAAALRQDYQRRAMLVAGILGKAANCRVFPPEGGMFVVLDVRASGMSSEAFARKLLEQKEVAVLPCDSFGPSGRGLVRIALTCADARLREAAERIVSLAGQLK
jgi:arginine:pyruvate transaminase